MSSRESRKQTAHETLEILKNGFYLSPNGERIDIFENQQNAENNTKVYSPDESDELLKSVHNSESELITEITIVNKTSLDAVRELTEKRYRGVLCLNFASAKNPGGGFLNGSQAQEESLVRSTGLYNCQLKAQEYYSANRATKSMFYTDYMIYCPRVPIIKDESGTNNHKQITCSFITAPAVNTGVVKQREPERLDEIEIVMKRRIRKVMAISTQNGHKTLVLGAWGCGVFQNNPNDIARYFKEVLDTDFKNVFERIVFAIYSKNERFINAFYEQFGR